MSFVIVCLSGFAGDKAHRCEPKSGGEPFIRFAVATHRIAHGEVKSDWHECVAFGRSAEKAAAINRGDAVSIIGRLEYISVGGEGEHTNVRLPRIVVDRVEIFPSHHDEIEDDTPTF